MKKQTLIFKIFCMTGLIIMAAFTVATAGDALRYSCSAQIHETFGEETMNQYTQATGIPVEIYPSSSRSAIYRLMNDGSDVAGSFSGLYYRQKESGYVETEVCKDPMAIIVNMKVKVKNLTEDQLKDIFSERITNWKEVGGPDEKIMVVVPGKDTAAYKNFRQSAMNGGEIRYSYMAEQSRDVLQAVRSMAYSISFITHGATVKKPGIEVLSVNGISVNEDNYPFYQTMYLITKGEAGGAVKKFIDFFQAGKGADIIREKGMIPVR